MFRLIGIFVVIGVLYVGYGAIQSWYAGDSTPQEAVTEVRKRVGETLVGDKSETVVGTGTSKGSPSSTQQSTHSQGKPLDTDEMLRQMMKK